MKKMVTARKHKLKSAKRTLKRRKAPKHSVRKIAVSYRERRFVIPSSIRIPISHRTFATIQMAPLAGRQRSFWKARFLRPRGRFILSPLHKVVTGLIKTRALFLKSSAKAVSAALIATVIFASLAGVGSTVSMYSDTEVSTGNLMVAGQVDFIATSTPWNPIEVAVSMAPGDSTQKIFGIGPGESNPFQYFASTTVRGDEDFCVGIQVSLGQGAETFYNGSLANLKTATTTSLEEMVLSATTGVNNFTNKVCDFDMNFAGWQTRNSYINMGGFNDTEVATGTIASWGFRINKVYYDVKTPERGEEGTNEWVEIYNQTNTGIDISGWEICDNTSCDTLPTAPLIPAQKYAVIVATSTTATSTTVSNSLPAFWYLPSEVTQININNLIGNGLANDADMLILKRPDGVIVDQMNWGTPNIGWTNYNEDVWNPGAIDVVEGNVLARVPSGHDTDAPSDWAEIRPPTVDLIYPDEGGSYTWYWNHNYNILWSATNNNGPDENLDISIFYVKDVNHDTIISLGDTVHTIAETTANDGLFNWTVPSGFLGYIWIHLVATGPENPMLNTGTVSGKIYDPFLLFIGPENVEVPEAILEVGEKTSDIPSAELPLQEVIAAREEEILPMEPVPEEIILEESVEVSAEPVVAEPSIVPEESPAVVENITTEPAPAEEASIVEVQTTEGAQVIDENNEVRIQNEEEPIAGAEQEEVVAEPTLNDGSVREPSPEETPTEETNI